MANTKLEKELQGGIASFTVVGKASISDDTFPQEISESKSGWRYKRIAFPVRVGDSNSMYVQMMGGYSKYKPELHVFNKDTNQMFTIDWDMRENKDILSNVASRSFIRIRLEQDDKGKLIQKEFISELDAIDYLEEHLKNDDEIIVNGNVEYQRYNGKIQRSFEITSITRNIKKTEPMTELRQTYLLENNALPRDWEKQLKENHEVTISAFVPQYIGKENGKEIKKTLAFPQQFTLKATDKNLDKRILIINKFLKVKKGVVRELGLRNEVLHGVERGTGNIKRTEAVQELIDLGIMTEEEVGQQETIGGVSVDKVIFKVPMISTRDGESKIQMADKYSPEALTIVEDDDDIEEGVSPFDEDNSSEDNSADGEEDVFDGLFSE